MRPLADRMRPVKLQDYAGQEHLVGKAAVLRQAIESGRLPSMIFWGPPGVGKTTLARLIANQLNRPFYALSAISSGVKDVREAIEKARKSQFFDQPGPLLFIDEIHRFSKAQQDALLGAVEEGTVTLIGATTENPSFEVISALLSRCQVYILKPLSRETLLSLAKNALEKDEVLKDRPIELLETEALLQFAGGDARKMYNILELVSNYAADQGKTVVTDKLVQQLVQQNIALYDKGGEQHYDIASAFIKSTRGSDPNAAVYWLARMIEGGENVRFIARRLVISAAEDIGLANPNALLLANTGFDAVDKVGMPESRIILSEVAIYLATSPKSNSAYAAIGKAQSTVRDTGTLEVPLHIRNAPTRLMKDLDYGKGYKYSHTFEGNFADQEYLPEAVKGERFYTPGVNPSEQKIIQRLSQWWRGKYGYGEEE